MFMLQVLVLKHSVRVYMQRLCRDILVRLTLPYANSDQVLIIYSFGDREFYQDWWVSVQPSPSSKFLTLLCV
jgi:hypothetical protein